MDVLEIISLRTLDRSREELAESVLAAVAESTATSGVRLALYRHTCVDTDLAIHLHRSGRRGAPTGALTASPLGLRLAAALGEHGQVNHSIWTAVQGKNEHPIPGKGIS